MQVVFKTVTVFPGKYSVINGNRSLGFFDGVPPNLPPLTMSFSLDYHCKLCMISIREILTVGTVVSEIRLLLACVATTEIWLS